MTATSSTPLDLNTVLSLIEELKAKGNIHFKARDYHHAITEYDRVIQEYTDIRSQDPNPIEKWMKENKNSCSKLTAMIGATFNNRAFCYFRLEMFTAAEDDATQAIKHKFWKGYYRRGCSNAALGEWNKARKDFSKAMKRFPNNKNIGIKHKQANQAWQQKKFFEAIESDHEQDEIETTSIKIDELPDVPSTYNGPKIDENIIDLCLNGLKNGANDENKNEIKNDGNEDENDGGSVGLLAVDKNPLKLNEKWMMDLHEFQKNSSKEYLPARYTIAILSQAKKLLETFENIHFYEHSQFVSENVSENISDDEIKENESVDDDAHITICGDIHGQYYDYLHIFKLNGYPSAHNPYLFNGDFVDRGSWSLEVILSMLCFKILYAEHFHLIRGNHETINMNNMYGFKGEIEHKYKAGNIGKNIIFPLFTQLFNCLPLGYNIGHKVFICHGGLCKQANVKLNEIQNLNRNCQPSLGIMSDLLWSDPQAMDGLAPSKRGGGTMFGPDITAQFLADNSFELLIRSHEVQEEGYCVAHNGKCVTIFSAPNYVDQMGNKGAFIVLDKDYKPHYTQFTAQPHPNIKPMAYGGGMFNFM